MLLVEGESDCDVLADTERDSEALADSELDCDRLELDDNDADAENDSDIDILVETELAEALSLADKVSDKDSTGLAPSDDKVVAASSLKTTSPLVARTSRVSITFSRACSSSA